jgi:hypothetical protein
LVVWKARRRSGALDHGSMLEPGGLAGLSPDPPRRGGPTSNSRILSACFTRISSRPGVQDCPTVGSLLTGGCRT